MAGLPSIEPVHERPADFTDAELAAALREHWDIAAVGLRYAKVGFGGHHWVVADGDGGRWFATANQVASDAAIAELDTALLTAVRLQAGAGLDFVVAPLPAANGHAACQVGPGYAVSLAPFAEGAPGNFGDPMTPADRAAVTGMLAKLHAVAAGPGTVPLRAPDLPGRAVLDFSCQERGRPWRGGPYAEPARAYLCEHAAGLQAALIAFDDLAAQLAAAGADLVITHGEPHPGNLLRRGPDYLLIDWDTVGLAWPERDLCWVVSDSGAESDVYARLTGRTVDSTAVALYRLRWDLDDVAAFLAEFRAPHQQDQDTEVAWAGFCAALQRLSAQPWRLDSQRLPEAVTTD